MEIFSLDKLIEEYIEFNKNKLNQYNKKYKKLKKDLDKYKLKYEKAIIKYKKIEKELKLAYNNMYPIATPYDLFNDGIGYYKYNKYALKVIEFYKVNVPELREPLNNFMKIDRKCDKIQAEINKIEKELNKIEDIVNILNVNVITYLVYQSLILILDRHIEQELLIPGEFEGIRLTSKDPKIIRYESICNSLINKIDIYNINYLVEPTKYIIEKMFIIPVNEYKFSRDKYFEKYNLVDLLINYKSYK